MAGGRQHRGGKMRTMPMSSSLLLLVSPARVFSRALWRDRLGIEGNRPEVAPSLALLLAICILLSAGCERTVMVPGPVTDMDVKLRVATDPDALEGAPEPIASFTLELRTSNPEKVRLRHVPFSSNDHAVSDDEAFEDLDEATEATLTVWAMTAISGERYSVARSGPFLLEPEEPVSLSLLLAVADAWTRLDLSEARANGAASALPDGRVLLVGGLDDAELESPVIFDPRKGELVVLEEGPRAVHPTLVSMSGGRVLVAGGLDLEGNVLSEAWLFDGTEFSRLPVDVHAHFAGMGVYLSSHNDVVLIAGGYPVAPGDDASASATDEVSVLTFDATGDVEVEGATLPAPRAGMSVTPLRDVAEEAVLLAGGRERLDGPMEASVFVARLDPGLEILPASHGASGTVTTLPEDWIEHGAAAIDNGHVLVLGVTSNGGASSGLVFSPLVSDPGAFVPVSISGASMEWNGEPLLASLPDGSVLVVGPAGLPTRLSSVRVDVDLEERDGMPERALLRVNSLGPLHDRQRVGGELVAMAEGSVMLLGQGVRPGSGEADNGGGEEYQPRAVEIFVPCRDELHYGACLESGP